MCNRCDRSAANLISRRDLLAYSGALTLAGALSSFWLPDAIAGKRSIDIICKSAWGARPAREGLVRHRIRRLTVHHSGVRLTDNRDAPARFRSHQAAHQKRGWPDIAYHVLIDRHGNIYKGRPYRAKGDTATPYDPRGHLLFMCEGDFSAQSIPGAQLRALADALAWACGRFGVAPSTIAAHRDFAQTACPGSDLYRYVSRGRLRRMVRSRLAHGGVDGRLLCGDAGLARVRAIEQGRDR